MGIFKNFKINERFNLKFDVQAFNIFNHPSFDTPNNNVEFNPFFENPPQYTAPFPVDGQTTAPLPTPMSAPHPANSASSNTPSEAPASSKWPCI